ncbi:MAG: MarR family transcriptional regulator [Saprospiraceae bacterium]|nr:MarR family transcriptional regulator [Saprospiraceae bacterium]
MKTIEQAIHQKHFADLRVKTDINLMYTSSMLSAEKVRMLRPMGLSPQQFNILRILRGVAPAAVSIRYLAERMIDQTSNASRLVDKLVEKAWVDRKICPEDRRQVEVRITEAGMARVGEASEVIARGMTPFDCFSEKEMGFLNELLDRLRNHLNPTI